MTLLKSSMSNCFQDFLNESVLLSSTVSSITNCVQILPESLQTNLSNSRGKVQIVMLVIVVSKSHNLCPRKGPSIYDVHTEGRGIRLRWTHVDGGRGDPSPCGRPHRKLKLESTDVIMSSSHAKKLASFLPEFRLWTEKK